MAKIFVTSSVVAYKVFKKYFNGDAEEFRVAALNSKKEVIAEEMLFKGTVDSCLIHPRDVFRFAIKHNASTIIISHNHPSGDCEPSDQDNKVTERIRKAGELLQIKLIDHIIVSSEGFYSYRDQGRLK